MVGIYSRDVKRAEKLAVENSVPMAFTNVDDLASCPHIDIVSGEDRPQMHARRIYILSVKRVVNLALCR